MPSFTTALLTKRAAEEAKPGDWLWDGGARGVSGFGLRVAAGGTKTFLYRYRTSAGQQRFVTLGRFPALTVEEGRQLAQLRAAEVAKGADPSRDRKLYRTAPTFADLASHYLGEYASSRGLRPATVSNAKTVLKVAVEKLGTRKVADVTTVDIRRLHGDLRKQGQTKAKARAQTLRQQAQEAPTGPTRIRLDTMATKEEGRLGQAGNYQANRLLAVLSKMFALAVELGWRTDNPYAGKGIVKHPEDQRWRSLSEDEVGRLLLACDAYEQEQAWDDTARKAANAIRLLLFTGARLREVLNADWSQFDLERGVWEKPSAHTKTKRQHWLELEGPALEVLRGMREEDPDGRFLFPGKSDSPFTGAAKPRADLKRPWSWIVREAALQGVRLHDLRRTTASFILSSGHSLAVVGKTLGHTQPATTARYAHLHSSVQREALGAAGNKMAALKAVGAPRVVTLREGRHR
ncbi:tyrosine-type recombinase/integrase [Asticcacaulis solisilvae]|uniref:tyrosine-type recombinase/integrase n=1 Tax=Asticcacaulis solisilvae TaxID=1217274 RepID=UPI003FD719C3